MLNQSIILLIKIVTINERWKTLNTIMSKTGYEEISKTGTATDWVMVPIRIGDQQKWCHQEKKWEQGRAAGTAKSLKPCYAFNIKLLSSSHIQIKMKK